MKWTFRDKKTGRFRPCRLANVEAFDNDPMTRAMGVDTGEFVEQWRKKDLRDGCPRCRADVLENASEPDVLQRWGLR